MCTIDDDERERAARRPCLVSLTVKVALVGVCMHPSALQVRESVRSEGDSDDSVVDDGFDVQAQITETCKEK